MNVVCNKRNYILPFKKYLNKPKKSVSFEQKVEYEYTYGKDAYDRKPIESVEQVTLRELYELTLSRIEARKSNVYYSHQSPKNNERNINNMNGVPDITECLNDENLTEESKMNIISKVEQEKMNLIEVDELEFKEKTAKKIKLDFGKANTSTASDNTIYENSINQEESTTPPVNGSIPKKSSSSSTRTMTINNNTESSNTIMYAEPESESQPETADSSPEQNTNKKMASELELESKPKLETKSETETVSVTKTAIESESKLKSETEPKPESNLESQAESQPKPGTESEQEPEPSSPPIPTSIPSPAPELELESPVPKEIISRSVSPLVERLTSPKPKLKQRHYRKSVKISKKPLSSSSSSTSPIPSSPLMINSPNKTSPEYTFSGGKSIKFEQKLSVADIGSCFSA